MTSAFEGPHEDPTWFFVVMMIVVLTTAALSITSTIVTLWKYFLRLPKFSKRDKLLMFLLINDLLQAINMVWHSLVSGGDYKCGPACVGQSVFVILFAFNHWQISFYICVHVYWQIIYLSKPRVGFRMFVCICLSLSLIFSLLPFFHIPYIRYDSYGWWNAIANDLPVLTFLYLLAPMFIIQGITIVTYYLVLRKISAVSAQAPRNTGKEYSFSTAIKMMIFPVGFTIIWMPACLWHAFNIFGTIQIHSSAANGLAIVAALFYGLGGFIDSFVFVWQFGSFRDMIHRRRSRVAVSQAFSTSLPTQHATSSTASSGPSGDSKAESMSQELLSKDLSQSQMSPA